MASDVTFIPTQGSGVDPTALLAMNGGMNGMWNSPFSYLMLLPFLYGMTGNGFGGFGGGRGPSVGQGIA